MSKKLSSAFRTPGKIQKSLLLIQALATGHHQGCQPDNLLLPSANRKKFFKKFGPAPASPAATCVTALPASSTLAPAPAMRVFRMRDLATTPGHQGLLPVSPATIWRWVKNGQFPQPFKLGEQTTVWDANEVEAFLIQRAGRAA